VQRPDGATRYFTGEFRNFACVKTHPHGSVYLACAVPGLWLPKQTTDCRIFQHMTVPEILEQVFREHGFTAYDMSGRRAKYVWRPYCV